VPVGPFPAGRPQFRNCRATTPDQTCLVRCNARDIVTRLGEAALDYFAVYAVDHACCCSSPGVIGVTLAATEAVADWTSAPLVMVAGAVLPTASGMALRQRSGCPGFRGGSSGMRRRGLSLP
jgi:hypothetical protein